MCVEEAEVDDVVPKKRKRGVLVPRGETNLSTELSLDGMMQEARLAQLTVNELKDILRQKGLPLSGTRCHRRSLSS